MVKNISTAELSVFRSPGVSDDLHMFSYHGVFPSMKSGLVTDYADSHQGGSPIVIYDPAQDPVPMTVFSPLDSPMAHHMASGEKVFGAGVKNTVQVIPAGWSQSFMLSAFCCGINMGMMEWGNRMLTYTGKKRADMYRY